MKSDPSAQLKLLDISALDSRALQLRHALSQIPELAEMGTLNAERAGVENAGRDARVTVEDLVVAQTKAEADVEAVRARRRRDQERIDSGAIKNPKDLEAMTRELDNLDRRIGVLEDEELEVMEQLETARAALTELDQKLQAYDERLATLAEARHLKAAEIEAQLEVVLAQRPALIEGVPSDLLALYEKIQASKGGAGAAELRARQCGGCGLRLDAAELGRIRSLPDTEVVRCEECSRILVRTDESGL